MKAKIVLFSALALTAVLTCYGLTKTTSLAIINSTLDNSPVGSTTPSTGRIYNGVWSKCRQPILRLGSYAGDSAGYLAFGQGATRQHWHGQQQMAAVPLGSEVFYLLGSSLTPEFWLDNNANAHFAGGVASSGGFTGNLSGNVTGNVSGNATTERFHNHRQCSNSVSSIKYTERMRNWFTPTVPAIAANGNGSCGTPVYARTTSVNSTAATAGSTASTTLSLQWNFGGTPRVGCDAGYQLCGFLHADWSERGTFNSRGHKDHEFSDRHHSRRSRFASCRQRRIFDGLHGDRFLSFLNPALSWPGAQGLF